MHGDYCCKVELNVYLNYHFTFFRKIHVKTIDQTKLLKHICSWLAAKGRSYQHLGDNSYLKLRQTKSSKLSINLIKQNFIYILLEDKCILVVLQVHIKHWIKEMIKIEIYNMYKA